MEATTIPTKKVQKAAKAKVKTKHSKATKKHKGRDDRGRNFCITWNGYTDTQLKFLDDMGSNLSEKQIKYLVFGKEVGEPKEDGGPGNKHLQMFIQFANARTGKMVEKMFSGPPQAHVEHMYPESTPYAASKYCTKDGEFKEYGERPIEVVKRGTRNDLAGYVADANAGMTTTDLGNKYMLVEAKFPNWCMKKREEARRKLIPAVEAHEFRSFQVPLAAIIDKEPTRDDRKVIFIVDFEGNQGKTWFRSYYAQLHPHRTIVVMPGPKRDMAHAIRGQLEACTKVIFFDCPRAKTETLQYDLFEELKDSNLVSYKYDSELVPIPPVHVVVFMNEEPDYTKLSIDRYLVYLSSTIYEENEDGSTKFNLLTIDDIRRKKIEARQKDEKAVFNSQFLNPIGKKQPNEQSVQHQEWVAAQRARQHPHLDPDY